MKNRQNLPKTWKVAPFQKFSEENQFRENNTRLTSFLSMLFYGQNDEERCFFCSETANHFRCILKIPILSLFWRFLCSWRLKMRLQPIFFYVLGAFYDLKIKIHAVKKFVHEKWPKITENTVFGGCTFSVSKSANKICSI